MILKVVNRPSKIEMKLLRKAAHWYAEKLFSTRLNKNVTIYLKFTKNLLKEQKSLGSCMWTEYNDRQKEFEIELDADLSQKNILKTLAHEMVHVKQYATGQMKDYTRSHHIKWEGKLFEDSESHNDDYWFYPWEIEAHGMEIGLYVLFRKHLKKEKMSKERDSRLD